MQQFSGYSKQCSTVLEAMKNYDLKGNGVSLQIEDETDEELIVYLGQHIVDARAESLS